MAVWYCVKCMADASGMPDSDEAWEASGYECDVCGGNVFRKRNVDARAEPGRDEPDRPENAAKSGLDAWFG